MSPRTTTTHQWQLASVALRDSYTDFMLDHRALLLFLADGGLRRAEVCALNWGDIDMQSGRVQVRQGKGRKDRTAVIGATTRRALLKYRRKLADHGDKSPLFQTDDGTRFTGNGLLAIFRRLHKRTGIHCNVHAMHRTFVILSLRSGMNVLVLQSLLGHESLEMRRHYAQLEDIHLLVRDPAPLGDRLTPGRQNHPGRQRQ